MMEHKTVELIIAKLEALAQKLEVPVSKLMEMMQKQVYIEIVYLLVTYFVLSATSFFLIRHAVKDKGETLVGMLLGTMGGFLLIALCVHLLGSFNTLLTYVFNPELGTLKLIIKQLK